MIRPHKFSTWFDTAQHRLQALDTTIHRLRLWLALSLTANAALVWLVFDDLQRLGLAALGFWQDTP